MYDHSDDGMIFSYKRLKIKPEIDRQKRNFIKKNLLLYFTFLPHIMSNIITYRTSAKIGFLIGFHQHLLREPHTLKEIKKIIGYKGNDKTLRLAVKIALTEVKISLRKKPDGTKEWTREKLYRAKTPHELHIQEEHARNLIKENEDYSFEMLEELHGLKKEEFLNIATQLMETGEVKIPTEEKFKAPLLKLCVIPS